MKKKIIIVLGILLAAILLIPIPLRLKDGGTVKYQALLYSISDVHRFAPTENDVVYEDGLIIEILRLEVFNNVAVANNSGKDSSSHIVKGDYPALIMVDGVLYYLEYETPAEIDDSAIIGYTNSYTDGAPQNNGETNFNRELNMPYAKVDDGIAVLYQNEWWLCKTKWFDIE